MDPAESEKRRELSTEKQNPRSLRIDAGSVAEILEIINTEDRSLAGKVSEVLPEVARAVELAVATLRKGGHIYYVGAGTSGRLGVLDAAEIPPTFSAPRDWFQGIIAGGNDALTRSIEGAEDHPEDAHRDLGAAGVSPNDLVIGIASSSATPYVVAALEYSHSRGAATVYLICNPRPLHPVEVDVLISVDVGPEVITGSTRMKSGTATKMVLNMISTATMVRLGKVYGNLMVDLMAVNQKLVDRGARIIQQLSGLSYQQARSQLEKAGLSVKRALVMAHKGCNQDQAQRLLDRQGGMLRKVIGDQEN